jgi:hypothetical protein
LIDQIDLEMSSSSNMNTNAIDSSLISKQQQQQQNPNNVQRTMSGPNTPNKLFFTSHSTSSSTANHSYPSSSSSTVSLASNAPSPYSICGAGGSVGIGGARVSIIFVFTNHV